MRVVFVNELICSYTHKRLYAGSIELDIDRMCIDPLYIERVLPGISPVCKYTLKILPYIDKGVYLIHTNRAYSTNLVSGVYTDTDEFDELFSFHTLLMKLVM
jgi:hypothetical protein